MHALSFLLLLLAHMSLRDSVSLDLILPVEHETILVMQFHEYQFELCRLSTCLGQGNCDLAKVRECL